jgi:DNA-directed RNA polymerase specialized sigma24 family protein
VVFLIPQAATKYFCRIIRSLIVNQIREMSRLEYRADLPEAVCEPQAELEKYILSDQIWEIAQRLPLKDRRLLDLYFDSDGSSFGEQCKALDISPSAARYRIGKIIAKLRIMTNGKT